MCLEVKKVKKFLCAALSFVLLLSLSVFAAAEGCASFTEYNETEKTLYLRIPLNVNQKYSLGDTDGDGRLGTADARLCLRYAVDLGKPDEQQRAAADVFLNGSTTAANARKILRISVGLDVFDGINIALSAGERCVIGPLKNAGSGQYNWRCEAEGLNITEKTALPGTAPGTPAEQSFIFEADAAASYSVRLYLADSSGDTLLRECRFNIEFLTEK